ncbi:MAG TPA: type IV secretory system conjugative DNA transfer family protein, partial [bacterium]|nr:type IV secretory system conjugative DNA transfer family protein [bacterium]
MRRLPKLVYLIIAGVGLAALSSLSPGEPAVGVPLAGAAWICFIAAATGLMRARRHAVPPPAGAAWAGWCDASDLAAPGALLLGLWPASRTPLHLDEEQVSAHVLVLGPSRTGKTAGVIAPNVLLRDPSRESVVVLDVKTGPRSLWNVTAGRYGARAALFCPLFERSVQYNPLHRAATIGGAQRVAALLIHNTTPRDLSGDAQVYASAAADLAALLFLHVQSARAAGGHTVGAVWRGFTGWPGSGTGGTGTAARISIRPSRKTVTRSMNARTTSWRSANESRPSRLPNRSKTDRSDAACCSSACSSWRRPASS